MNSDFKRGHQTAFMVTTAAGLEGRCRSELRKLLGQVEFRALFLKGNLLLLCDLSEQEVAERVKAAETTYVARMSPVQYGQEMRDQAGMIREVVTIAGAIFAVVLAGLFYQELAKDVAPRR